MSSTRSDLGGPTPLFLVHYVRLVFAVLGAFSLVKLAGVCMVMECNLFFKRSPICTIIFEPV